MDTGSGARRAEPSSLSELYGKRLSEMTWRREARRRESRMEEISVSLERAFRNSWPTAPDVPTMQSAGPSGESAATVEQRPLLNRWLTAQRREERGAAVARLLATGTPPAASMVSSVCNVLGGSRRFSPLLVLIAPPRTHPEREILTIHYRRY